MNLTQILEATVSPDQNELQQAQTYLEQAAQENLPQFLVALVNELADAGKSQVARMAAGLQLKNALTSKDENIRIQHQQRWLSLDEEVKQHVKQMVIQTLGTEEARPAIAPQCIAAIACTEIPKGQWLEVIDILHKMVWAVASKEQVLQSIGYICEDIEPHHITGRSREIQAAIVVGGMINRNINIKLTAFNALLRSLKVLEPRFNVETEWKFIMEIVCEATKSDENQVRVIALQNLVKIMKRYYQHMERYMVDVLPISISAIESNCDEVALQGIEFWSSVCDKEIGLANEAAECCESKFYAKDALKDLIPVLINFLNRQGGLDDKDDWNPHKAAGVCLMLLAECCQDDVYHHVLTVLTQNSEEDYRSRDAAFMAFGFFLEGPHQNAVKPYFKEALFFLIQFACENVIVTDSLAWTLCRICELLPHVALENIYLLKHILLKGIDGEPCVGVNACMVLMSLMVAFGTTVQHEKERPLIYDWTAWLQMSEQLFDLNRRLDPKRKYLKDDVEEASRSSRRLLEIHVMPMLVRLMKDESVIVTHPLAWTLCRICELLPHVALANTEPLVNILSEGLDKEPRAAVKVCSVLRLLMVTFIENHAGHEEEAPLIGHEAMWLSVSEKLDDLIRRLDANQEDLKSAVEEASSTCQRVLEMYIPAAEL